MKIQSVDAASFKKVLAQNVAFPLGLTVLLCAIFVGMILNGIRTNEELVRSAQYLRGVSDVYRLIVDSETGLRGYLMTGGEAYLEPYIEAQRELPQQMEGLRARAENSSVLVRVEKVATDLAEWRTQAESAITGRRRGNARFDLEDAAARKLEMDAIRSELATIQLVAERLRDERNEASARTTRLTVSVVVLLSAFFGGLLAFLGRRQLLGLSQRYEQVLDAQRTQAEELARQAWIRTGQIEIVGRVRGEFSTSRVSQEVLGFVAEYVGAKVGAVFAVGERGFLERAAGLALAPGAPERFGPGEGLVGRVGELLKPVHFDDVPETYLRITSSLGEAPPKHLVLAPLTADGRLEGVIELGFSEKPDARATDFLAEIRESIGLALRSAVYRTRLQDLLHESQQLTEELQTQQEELRVSNEELAERTNALQESQLRMESQHAELEQTNEQLEEQAQLLESQRSDLDERNAALEGARETLQKKAEELELASRYKSEFMANMSHELRTPLNSSLILAKLLQDNPQGNLSEEQVHFASTIYEAGNDLLNLINDILDLSKVEAGKLELNVESLSVPRIAQGLERLFRPTAEEKRIEFEVRVDPLAAAIVTDRQRLDQILRNLLSNAFKFTSQGKVSLDIRPNDAGDLLFAVRDTGIGIDVAQHERIFEAFHQADGTISRKFGGTGLGLSISRSLTHLLGGELELTSAPGQGSTFTLRLPRNATAVPTGAPAVRTTESLPEPAKQPAVRPKTKTASLDRPEEPSLGLEDDREAIGPKDRRILLVVEDDREFAKILLDLGRELDFKVLLAATTASGFELAVSHKPTAIVLDIKLPDASGLTLLNQLKDDPRTRHIPVHGVSGNDYTRAALQLGAIGHLIKPIARKDLKAALGRLEEKSAQKVKRVLLVEDDSVQQESIEKLIGGQGVELVAVDSGKEALKALRKSAFDCMIVDLKLPDMTGFELLETMSIERLESPAPPVIVYTGRDLSRAEEERLQRYSKSIIIKGARSPERLLDEVTLFLHRVESSLTPEAQRILRTSRNRERSFEQRSIMIVDDDVRNIFALRSALEAKGAKTIVARTGREALDALAAASPAPDLILMDIMMPEMDGYEAIKAIRKDKAYAELPIIAVTARAMRDDYERCLQAGANDYLAKPVDLDKLISLMRVWLPREIGGLG